jgi:hypothetical protein
MYDKKNYYTLTKAEKQNVIKLVLKWTGTKTLLLILKGNSPEKSVWTMAEMNMPKNYFIKGTLA